MFTYKDFEPLANIATGGVHVLAKKDGKYDLPLPKLVAYIKAHPGEVRLVFLAPITQRFHQNSI